MLGSVSVIPAWVQIWSEKEWKDNSPMHKLYIQEKKKIIDLVLPEFFLDQVKAISQLSNTV